MRLIPRQKNKKTKKSKQKENVSRKDQQKDLFDRFANESVISSAEQMIWRKTTFNGDQSCGISLRT